MRTLELADRLDVERAVRRVPVFISYHGSDLRLANDLRRSLIRLSSEFDVFLDKYSLKPSDDYEGKIAEEIAKSEWFLIVCTGFPHRDADMLWSFYEAGQFRATLPTHLTEIAERRIVCLYDLEPPAVLARFHGVKVERRDLVGTDIEVDAGPAAENGKLDGTSISALLADMLVNEPMRPLRDPGDPTTREMLREESCKIIKLFEDADPGKKISERTLQPRISFELAPGEELTGLSRVRGYEQSLRTLFGLDVEEAPWAHIANASSTNGMKPFWISDVEAAAASIMRSETPDGRYGKCLLRGAVYSVFTARYEIYKDRKRIVYVAFLPVSDANFDLTRRSSIILASLILSTRFREQIIPQVEALAGAPDVQAALLSFYRNLVTIEIEAKQFGLDVDTRVIDEPPLVSALSCGENRREVMEGIKRWQGYRVEIASMFSGSAASSPAEHAARLLAIIGAIDPVNRRFIEILTAEMALQVKREKPTD